MSADDATNSETDFRFQAWLQRSPEGVFLLNRRRRLVFANRAWERATGLFLKEVRGRACRRRTRTMMADKTESILGAMAPPPEAWKGDACEARRLLPGIGRENHWVTLAFVPLGAGESLLGIVGVIKPLADPPLANQQPLPEKWLALRDRDVLSLEDFAGGTAAMSRVAEQLRLAASQPGLPVSFVGPTGAGKRTAARLLHRLSAWRQRFFACLDCDRLPPDAVAEVVFSERSTRPLGFILLKEPAALPRELQERLAAALDDREEGSPRIVAAFGVAPEKELQTGRLMERLCHRLSALTIHLPGLAERREDLPGIIDRLLAQAASLLDKQPGGVAPEALQHLRLHTWPGNFHELRRVLRDAADRAHGERITPEHLPMYLRGGKPPAERSFPLDALLEKVERRLIELTLRLADGNRKKASDLLGIWRARLIRRIEALGIDSPQEKEE